MSPPNPDPHLTLTSPTPETLPALQRLNTLLLPVSYPSSFYTSILSDPTTLQLTKLVYYDATLVAAVRCRLEVTTTVPCSATSPPSSSLSISASPPAHANFGTNHAQEETTKKIYIMTLCTLSPYRHLGAGSLLLSSILQTATELGANEVYAHVWEANEDALEWYKRRGFEVGEVVGGYYRRLKPAGARVVVRRVGVGEYLRVEGEGRERREVP